MAAGSQCLVAFAKEVLFDLGVAEGFHVFFASVDAAARLVKADYGHGFGWVAAGAG